MLFREKELEIRRKENQTSLYFFLLFITGTVPTFSGGGSPISISESLTVGSSVTVVSLTDDFGDQFMFSDLVNPYFEINQTTGIPIL